MQKGFLDNNKQPLEPPAPTPPTQPTQPQHHQHHHHHASMLRDNDDLTPLIEDTGPPEELSSDEEEIPSSSSDESSECDSDDVPGLISSSGTSDSGSVNSDDLPDLIDEDTIEEITPGYTPPSNTTSTPTPTTAKPAPAAKQAANPPPQSATQKVPTSAYDPPSNQASPAKLSTPVKPAATTPTKSPAKPANTPTPKPAPTTPTKATTSAPSPNVPTFTYPPAFNSIFPAFAAAATSTAFPTTAVPNTSFPTASFSTPNASTQIPSTPVSTSPVNTTTKKPTVSQQQKKRKPFKRSLTSHSGPVREVEVSEHLSANYAKPKSTPNPNTNPVKTTPTTTIPTTATATTTTTSATKKLKTQAEIEKIEDPLARAEEYKNVANHYIQDGQYEQSIHYYTRAIDDTKDTPNPNLVVYYANRGLAHLKFLNYGSAIADCTKAISIDPNYPKAFYRRGTAYVQLKKMKEALDDFNTVLFLVPNDVEATRQVKLLESEMKKHGGALNQPVLNKSSSTVSSVQHNNVAHQPRAATRTVLSPPYMPMPWSPSLDERVPKLIDLSARCIAAEAANHVSVYLESFKSVPAEHFKQIVVYMDWPTLHAFKRDPAYRDSMNSFLIYSAKKMEEDYYRKLFATARNHPVIQDPFLTLIEVHKHMDLFTYEQEDAYEASICKLLQSPRQTNGLAVVPYNEFIENFNIFTHNQLSNLASWENVFVAGGSVLAALMPTPRSGIWEYYHNGILRGSDIDLFIFGLTVEQANKKLVQIYDSIRQQSPSVEYRVFRTKNCISIVSKYPRRHIQIVLRLYKSPAEILMGFDIDSCCVGFDGIRVLAHPRCARALKLQFNMVDLSRRSKSYEYRLYKYSKRGFAVAVPDLDLSRVDPSLHPSKPGVPRTFTSLKFQYGLRRLLYWNLETKMLHNGTRRTYPTTRYYVEKEKTHELEKSSDYSTVCIPYGPNWSAEDCVRCVYRYNRTINDEFHRKSCKPPREIVRICVIGALMEEVLADGQEVTSYDPSDPTRLQAFNRENMWVTDNPGTQLTGSFNPIYSHPDEWFKSGYTVLQ